VGARCAIGIPPLSVSLVHQSQVHYPGVLRQDLYPCVLTKISFLLAGVLCRLFGYPAWWFAWASQDSNSYSPCHSSRQRLISFVLSNQPDLLCCRLFHLGFIWVWVVTTSSRASVGAYRDGQQEFGVPIQDWQLGRRLSTDFRSGPFPLHAHTGTLLLDWYLMKDLRPPFRLTQCNLRK